MARGFAADFGAYLAWVAHGDYYYEFEESTHAVAIREKASAMRPACSLPDLSVA